MTDYAWRRNNACVATYRVLQEHAFLDQFDQADHPFEDASGVKMGDLLYFPRTTANPDIIELLADQIARRFLKFVMKIYAVDKQDAAETSGAIIGALAKIFEDKKKTILDLAEVVDAKLRFPDEN